jgi:hypothetical protein
MNEHSFACQVLRENGFKIFAGGKEILSQEYTKTHAKLITKIEKNSDFKKQFVNAEITEIRDTNELKNLGFKIMKYSALSYAFSFKNQKVVYKLVRLFHPTKDVCINMPTDHYAEYDKLNQAIRLKGKNVDSPFGNGIGEWISIKEKREAPDVDRRGNPLNIVYIHERGIQALRDKIPFGKKKEYINIPEGVIGVADDGRLVCIEKPRHTDMPFIIIYGSRRNGKSLLESVLECIFYHKFLILCCNVNDIKPETHTRCMEWEEEEFITHLKMFGEPTVPEPGIYLNPTTKNNYEKIYDGEVGFSISLPLKQLLKDENIITYNPAWKLKVETILPAWVSLIYKQGELRKDGLINARTSEEAVYFIDTEIKDKGMKDKIMRIITDIFNSKIIDRSSGISSKWILDTGEKQIPESAWNVCMLAKLFPFINTSGIRDEIWFPLWLRYVIQDILDFAKQNHLPVMIFMDEIAPILKEKSTREIVEQAVRECGSAGVGVCMVSHYGGDVSDAIQLQAGYEFVFRTSDQELISRLKKQKGLSKDGVEAIPNLKQFECYAFGDFILYDTDGTRETNNGKPIKMKIKYPNCRHYGGG